MSMDYVFKIFDYLHSHPEVSGEEIVTSEYLAGELKKSGFKVKEQVNGSRGVIGVWDSGKKGKKIALRADMDALPYIEEGKRVAKHTCGHDAHCAMVLAAAKQIQNHELSGGTLVVIFQPSEETHTGALDMANSGFLNEVDEMIGIHIRPQEEMKAGQATCGLCHGAICLCRVVVDGVSAHGARPQQGRNAVEAAIAMIQSIYTVHVDSRISHSCKVTRFVGGGVENIIPDHAEFTLDIRSQTNLIAEEMKDKIANVVRCVASAYGVGVEIDMNDTVPAAEYDEMMMQDAKEVIREVLGKENALEPIETPGGEDFHFYKQILQKCKMVYIGIGADAYPGLHNRDMQFKHEIMEKGVEILEKLVRKRLESL